MRSTTEAEQSANALTTQVAHFRDDYYRDGFRVVMLSLAMVIAAIALLIVLSLYFFLHQVLPISFQVYEGWRVQPDVPVDRPYLHIADLLQWVSQTLPGSLNLDFVNYTTEIKANAAYFTSNGWAKYLSFTTTYMSQEAILRDKVFVQAVPSGAPVILNQGVVDGKYGWWVQMPVDVRYSGVEGTTHNTKLLIQALIVRIPTLNNLDGVAIENLIANPAK